MPKAPQKRKPGRPPTGRERRSQILAVRAQPSQIARWQRLAEAAGVSFAGWVIAALERAEKRER
jgi:predicted HicB family RNase H-like nuclease